MFRRASTYAQTCLTIRGSHIHVQRIDGDEDPDLFSLSSAMYTSAGTFKEGF